MHPLRQLRLVSIERFGSSDVLPASTPRLTGGGAAFPA
jgi:hypothetical protein